MIMCPLSPTPNTPPALTRVLRVLSVESGPTLFIELFYSVRRICD